MAVKATEKVHAVVQRRKITTKTLPVSNLNDVLREYVGITHFSCSQSNNKKVVYDFGLL